MKNTKKATKGKKINVKLGRYATTATAVLVVVCALAINNSARDKKVKEFKEDAWTEAVSKVEKKVEPPAVRQEYEPEEKVVATSAKVMTEEEIIEEIGMINPTSGAILKPFSEGELVYSKTTDDWRTHNGADLAATENGEVKAAADGVISKAYEDKLLGFVIEIVHTGGVTTRYGNLSGIDMVQPEAEVKKGDVIGNVGTSSVLEAGEETHLHFEVLKDSTRQNPERYIRN
ncbi:MAG: M23 family metallopeptidase [Clostridia bacterium]|nr:M23 family metallopeptidase [Clostridia bacterium]